ncbi:hypothetical protein T03_13735 [Trichinella britovi]|uniref:Uncharacterized protein n=1 Tax=Trichinella britovi TaxID=45882 RepID=A0A0V1DIU1_TRIBR|nr:hypothetical protein T03_13735 [Trichinella britovi]
MCRLIYWASSSASVRVALQSDIAKMYLQVGLHERDHDVCRFLWRRDEVGSSPFMYRFTWVFWFGLPSLLGHERCKISPGSTSGPFPTMLDKMKFKIYVENLVVSCESLPIARRDILRLSAHSQAWEVPDSEEKIWRVVSCEYISQILRSTHNYSQSANIFHKSLVIALYRHLTIKCDHSASSVEPSAVEPQTGKLKNAVNYARRRAAQSTSYKICPNCYDCPSTSIYGL